MKIILDIPDGIIAGFFNGVERVVATALMHENKVVINADW